MKALITAGGVPQPGEPLYEETRGTSKALLEVAGKPMIQWVLDALSGAAGVERVTVVGLSPESGVTCAKPMDFLPDQGALLDNFGAGITHLLQQDASTELVLAVASDIPALTSGMVDWTVETALQSDHDLYYNVVERSVMEARFPESRRSYVRLKDAEVCGGDMNVVRARIVTDSVFWEKMAAARKNPLKQARLVGIDILLLVLLRQLTLQAAARRISRRLRLRGRAIRCPYPEIAMDVDKPHQLEILRRDLAARRGPAA